MPIKKRESRLALTELAAIDPKDNAAKVLSDIRARVNELMARDGEVDIETRIQMAADLERLDAQVKAQDAIIKNANRTLAMETTLPRLFASRLIPDDSRVPQAYYNLVNLTADELRFGAAMRTIPGSRMQVDARRVEDASSDLINELHVINDRMYVADMVLCGNGQTAYARISSDPGVRMKSLKLWARWEKVAGEFQRVLETATAAAGGNWIPTQLSARLTLMIQPELRVAALFQTVDMPNKTFDMPVHALDMLAKHVGEGVQIPATDITTNKITFTAVKLSARNVASSEVLEDSAVALEPFITANVAKAIGRGIEHATINGDSQWGAASGTLDWSGDSDNGGVASNALSAWDGLRKHALINTAIKVDMSGAIPTMAKLLSMKAQLGTYGVIPSQGAWIVGFKQYVNLLTLGEASLPSAFLTVEKYGAGATILTGEVGQLFGSPVVLSEFVRQDVSATGVDAATLNTFSTLLYVNRECFALGRRRDITLLRSNERLQDTDQIEYTGTWRGHFRDIYATASAANLTVAIGYNHI
jgi:hypothetical protein